MHIQAEAEDRTRMALWDGGCVIKDEPEDDEEEVVVKSESEYEVGSEEEEEEEEEDDVEAKKIAFQVPESSKRKRLSRAKLKEAKAKTRSKGRVVERWSVERYEMAEQSMLEILKSEGATFEKPITRAALRVAARKHIGDTGLLDHLLKHIEGKTAPGGTQRFRRWFNKNGVMEYWLEDANLLQLRAQAHVRDPYWLPPPPSNDLLRQRTTHLEDLFKDMLNWKAQTDQNLKLILTSWKAMQDMYSELMAWKAKLEPQLVGFKSVLNSLQASKPEDRWEDWLDSTNLDDLYSSLLPLPPNNATNRDIRVDHLNVTPDSSTTANSVPDFHNSSSPLCQELFVDLFNWKAKMEETVTEISNRINMIKQGQA